MRLQKPLVISAALLLACTLAGLVGVNLAQTVTIQGQSATISALATNSDALRDQVKDSGQKPVAPPADSVVASAPKDGAPGSRGDDGQDGRPGLPGVTGLTGLTGELGATGAPGSPGATGSDGSDGSAGAAGSNGSDGADSTTPGPAGATGADSTVPGPSGPTGPGIASIACQADGTWLFTLTDTTTREVTGPCRVDPITTPPKGVAP